LVLTRWAEADPATALAEANQMTGQYGPDAVKIVEARISGLSRATLPDPDTALAEAQATTNNVSAGSGVNDNSPSSKNPEDDLRTRAFWKAFGAYVATGRAADAVAFVTSLPESEERQHLVSDLARQWTYVDLQGATAWASQVTNDPTLFKAVWDGLKERWMRVDPASAVQFALASFPAGETRTAEFRNVVAGTLSASAGYDHDDDIAWNMLQHLPAGPEHDAVTGQLANRWTEYAPDKAAQLVATMTPGAEQTRLAVKAAEQWAIWDPASASAWAVSFPAGPARDTALAAVAQQWAGNDAAAASDWLQTLPAGSAQARAAESYVDKVVNQHPELAARWVALMTNEQKRNQQIEKIGQQWLKSDPAAAQAWLETARSRSAQKPPESWRSQ
jgi:hypothetical protein